MNVYCALRIAFLFNFILICMLFFNNRRMFSSCVFWCLNKNQVLVYIVQANFAAEVAWSDRTFALDPEDLGKKRALTAQLLHAR